MDDLDMTALGVAALMLFVVIGSVLVNKSFGEIGWFLKITLIILSPVAAYVVTHIMVSQ
jgi:hypothetical protein